MSLFSFQTSSQCRISKDFGKFLTMLHTTELKCNIVRNFCQAWSKSSLASLTKISKVSSESSKISKIQLCEEYLNNFKIPHNAGFEKFLKNSSQCWIHPGKNPTLWGIFVKLELNHRWDQRQRSQWCPQKLQRFQKTNFVRNTWKMVSFFILKFLTMLCLISFWKIPHNVGFIQVKIQPFWHHLQFF